MSASPRLPEVLIRNALPSSNFLTVEGPEHDFARARYRILPVPYEASVSYGGGTRGGPAAILDASSQIEFYDAELDLDPSRAGICTLPAVAPDVAGPEVMAHRLRAVAEALRETGRIVIALGGEHSITPPLALPYLEDPDVWVLCIDAHADPHFFKGIENKVAYPTRDLVAACKRMDMLPVDIADTLRQYPLDAGCWS